MFREETERLAWTMELYRQVLEEARILLENLPSAYRDNSDLLNDLLLLTHNRIARLERNRGKPYFARIDFTGSAAEETERCYIGKIGVSDGDNRIITVDWRAPVATLYYDSNVGPVAYEAPGGMVAGTLELKRQIEVEDGKLVGVHDVDTVANDDLLLPYLGVNADSRLKSIVASIQGEQNRIIREKLERNVVVQGAAGSGKTTVALHRIAYLAYAFRETIQPSQYMVIGPNPYFISYISSVLPDLDVDSVPQYTFAQLAGEYVGEDFRLTDSYETLCHVVAGRYDSSVERFKTSMRYKDALDRFLADFERSVLPEEDFGVRGFPVLSREELARAYAGARVTSGGTIQARADRCVLMLSALIKNRRDALELELSAFFRVKYRSAQDAQDLGRMHSNRAAIEKELERGCIPSLKKFFSRTEVKTLSLYRQFLQDCPQYLDASFGGGEDLKKRALSLLRKKTLTPEDLAAVMYLKERIKGAAAYAGYRHAIVDEAQDYGEFEVFVLTRVLSGATFTVVGDLAQSVFGYRSVESWDPVLRDAFAGNALLYEMRKSYRTTVEIMEAANLVAAGLGLADAEPVIRHGDPVGVHPAAEGETARLVAGKVLEYQKRGLQSIAVISKTQDEARAAGEALRGLGLPVRVAGDAEPYAGGLCSVSAYQAKGLEFDGVILPDASEAVYSGRRADQHLLYVAMTRPLHRLELFYTGRLSAPLRGMRAKG